MPSLKPKSRASRAAKPPAARSGTQADEIAPPNLPTAAWLRSFRPALRAWFDRAKRDLPWRRTRDPYAVWVSEVMLQQTQVATVVGFFERFLKRLPSIGALAAAPQSEVFRLWEGLGYYRRARQLHRAAQAIVERHGGEFPRDLDAAQSLPGIGRYTAGAVLSIAFDARLPILEANTVRLIARLAAFDGDAQSRAGQQLLWAWAEALVPDIEPGFFNQALMELGALVCTPREPRCEACPVARLCAARRLRRQDQIPRPKPRPTLEDVREAALVVRRGAKLLIVERATGTRWAGLWDFPRFAVEAESPVAASDELQKKLAAAVGVRAEIGRRIALLKHGVTRFRITLEAYEARHVGGRARAAEFASARWVGLRDLSEYPMNTTGRKLAKLLQAAEG